MKYNLSVINEKHELQIDVDVEASDYHDAIRKLIDELRGELPF